MIRWVFAAVFVCSLTAFVVPEGEEFNLLTYNIRYANSGDGEDAWPHRKSTVLDVLLESDAPIIGLQEVLHDQLQYLSAGMPGYQALGCGRDDGKTAGEYNPLLIDTARFRIVESNTFWLSTTPGTPSRSWKAACNRICTWARLTSVATGEEILVYNTHFDHASGQARSNSVGFFCHETLQQLPATNQPTTRPKVQVLMGDFNAQLYGDTHYTLHACWNTPDVNCKREGPEGTFNHFDPDTPASKRIDFIYTKGTTGLSYAHLDPRTGEGRCASDHLPVLARVRVNP